MRSETLCAFFLIIAFAASAFAQKIDSCSALMKLEVPSLEITKATHVEAGSTEPIPWNQSRSAPFLAIAALKESSIGELALTARVWDHLRIGYA